MRAPSSAGPNRATRRIAYLIAGLSLLSGLGTVRADVQPIPFVKQWKPLDGRLVISSAAILADDAALHNETEVLQGLLADRGIAVQAGGISVRLELGDVAFPDIHSRYRTEIEQQGYQLRIDHDGVTMRARTPSGIYYAIQTLAQLVAEDKTLPCVEVLDWPDLAIRGIMLDSARANENSSYYERALRFCAHYKINRLHLHLTDDENACLYQEDYPSIMHPHAWRAEQLAPLVSLACRLHVEVVAEIESLGHARLFVRYPDRAEILHQTTDKKPKKSWAGTSVPGLTNVLCPASELTYEYLDKMYKRVAEIFPAKEIHIGCDEVDMTECARCRAKFGDISHGEWFLKHFVRCRALAERYGRRVGLWGDVLLRHKEIVDRIPTEGTVIYDWHYNPDMADDSVTFFTEKGFDVIGCPALMCHPHMILPSDYNYGNIHRFAELARAHDIHGLDTTVWTPTRYMSDALWPGVAYAAAHAWGGSSWNDEAFYSAFVHDFFGSSEGAAFGKAWSELASIRWWLDDFKMSCWSDDDALAAAAQAAATAKGAEAAKHRQLLQQVLQTFDAMDASVQQNRVAWQAIVRSGRILDYVLEHFLASSHVRQDQAWNKDVVAKLDANCTQALAWIEEDWDRNRFADDPYKQDLNHTGQHLLDWFRRMHAYHGELLSRAAKDNE